jgi:hypothetical protein
MSRRTALKATGALGTIAALAVPVVVMPKAEAADHADDKLLRLEAERERNAAALDAEQARNAPIYAEWESLRSRWCAESPTAPFDEFMSHPVTNAHSAAVAREDIFCDEMDRLADRIREVPAKTLAGLAVKARLASEEFGDILAFPRTLALEDWQIERVMSFFCEVERLATEATHV